MNSNLLVPTLLLLLSLFATSFAYQDGAHEESCYNHSIVHNIVISPTLTLDGDPSVACNEPCLYKLYVVGEIGQDGALIKNESNPNNFTYKLSTTYQFSLRTILLPNGLYPNGFSGFLIQARESSDTFVPESSIHGTWEDNRPLYKPLNCGKSMADTSVLYPNSATQRQSSTIAHVDRPDYEVLLYWISPAEQADAATVVFWYTIVQQHRAHFLPLRGPVGNPPPTADKPGSDEL